MVQLFYLMKKKKKKKKKRKKKEKIHYATYIINRNHNVKYGSKKNTAIYMFAIQFFMLNVIMQTFYISHKQVLQLISISPIKTIPYHKNYGQWVILKQILYVQ